MSNIIHHRWTIFETQVNLMKIVCRPHTLNEHKSSITIKISDPSRTVRLVLLGEKIAG